MTYLHIEIGRNIKELANPELLCSAIEQSNNTVVWNLHIIRGLSRCVTTDVAWMDGGSRAAGTSGKRRAASRNRRLGRRRGRGLRGARVQARLGRRTGGQTGKPTAQIEPDSRSLVIT